MTAKEGCSITLVGNIAAGKTTFAHILAERLPTACTLFLENPSDYPFVELAFHDPYRWSCTNQLDFLLTKAAQEQGPVPSGEIFVREMDLAAAHEVWSPALLEVGLMTAEEFGLCQRLFEALKKNESKSSQMYVYLMAAPATILERVARRGRQYESATGDLAILVHTLNKHLERFIAESDRKFIINTDKINMAIESADRAQIISYIQSRIEAGLC